MSASKLLNQYGLTAVLESTYGDGATPTNSDGILPLEVPAIELDYIHDGDRGRSPMGGNLRRVGRAGRGGSLSLVTQALMPAAAYAASVRPNLDVLLRAGGCSATVDTTPGSENIVYAPEGTGFESASLVTYHSGQSQDLHGVYTDWTIAAEGPVVPTWTFECSGIGQLPADAAVPSITYINLANQPPRAQAMTVTIGAFSTAVVRGFEFSLNRELAPRADDNATNGHAGFSPGNRDPRLVITVEAVALSTYNPYTIAEADTTAALALTVGSTQYNRFTINMLTANLVDVRDAEDGPTRLWELEFAPTLGDINADNDFNITFN